MRETTFSEVMAGPATLRGETDKRLLRLELDVTCPGLLKLWSDTEATMTGRVSLPGIADDPRACGTLQIAPLRRRRLRYRLAFRAMDGRQLRLDGWKTVRLLRPLRSMTTLPATLYEDDSVLGEALLAFDLRDLPRFLATFRYRRAAGRARRVPKQRARRRHRPARVARRRTLDDRAAVGAGRHGTREGRRS